MLTIRTTLADSFEAQAACTPDAVALSFEGQSLTYASLNARANQLAHYLLARRVGPEAVVGLALDRSLTLVVAILAVAKTGAAYLPLDPEYPADRLACMLADARPICVVTSKTLAIKAYTPHVVLVNEQATVQEIARSPARDVQDGDRSGSLTSQHPAYVIYTSGSTGVPKGVVVTHENVLRLFTATDATFQFDQRDVWTLFHSCAFDFSVWELWGALLTGGRLVILPYVLSRSPDDFLELLARERVTVLNQTPSAFYQLMDADGERRGPASELALRYVIFGGEALDFSRLESWYARHPAHQPLLINMFGITETTVHVTCLQLDVPRTQMRGGSLIGQSISDLRVYVLDANLEPVRAGAAGELYVSGPGLARGYLRRTGLTAQRFVADPFGVTERMYRTGDVVKRRPDGGLEYLGRADRQVKVRGFRIELGDIEAAIERQPGVARAVVLLREETSGEKQLVGYVTAVPSVALDSRELRRQCAASLPDYMVPAAVVVLDRWPLTANGKLDCAALPEPDQDTPHTGRAPRTPEEAALCELFQDVLGVGEVGIDDDFFMLGGHSLLATRLVARIRGTLCADINVRMVFETPTVRALAERVRGSERTRLRLAPVTRPESVPLSYSQQRFWYVHRLRGGASIEYHLTQSFALQGELDVEALNRAIQRMIARHEILRTRFEDRGGVPVQVIDPHQHVNVAVEDLREVPTDARPGRIEAAIREQRYKPFDLSAGPLLRIRLLRVCDQEHVLVRTLHHIISDGWSEAVFDHELSALYYAYSRGGEDPLPPLPLQYADFAVWQRTSLGDPIREGLEYWTRQLRGAPERSTLPTDRPRPSAPSCEAGIHNQTLPNELTAALRSMSQTYHTTQFMTLLAAFMVVLARHADQDDLVIGTPIANRQESQLEGLLGCFVNSLALRVHVPRDASFRSVLESVRRTTLDAYKYQDVPFERVVDALGHSRHLNTSPVFQALFALHNAPTAQLTLAGLDVEPLGRGEPQVRLDLELHAWERNGGIALTWLYNRALFDGWRIVELAEALNEVLRTVLAEPDASLTDLDGLSAAARDTVLRAWNDTNRETRPLFVAALFEEQADRQPDAIALVAGRHALTYRTLNTCANRLARALLDRGVGPEDTVGIAAERGVSWVLAMLGVWKAGAAFVPLDSVHPFSRLNFIVSEVGPRLILATDPVDARLPNHVPTLLIDEFVGHTAHAGDVNPKDEDRTRPLNPAYPAYVLYTSGSTGLPKGVVILHAGLTNLAEAQREHLSISARSRILQFAAIGFDASVWELVMALTNGATLVLPDVERQASSGVADLLKREAVTHATLPPVIAATIPRAAASSVQKLIVAGDVVAADLLCRWGTDRVLINAYGPTETSVCATMSPPLGEHDEPAIGRPIRNTRVYVLDAALRPVPVGVTGEIYIAGAGLGRGYINQGALTAGRFVADAYGAPGARMYRSGDLARWLPGGQLEFVGRVDRQVKILGCRVELGEIEAVLRQSGAVSDVIVLGRVGLDGATRLRACWVPIAGSDWNIAELRTYLRQHLPEYMVPREWLRLSQVPLTAHGKVDRDALATAPCTLEHTGSAPGVPGTTQHMISTIWRAVLDVEHVGIDDNFFDVGGHSLLLTQVYERLRGQVPHPIDFIDLFRFPTIASLAEHLDSTVAGGYHAGAMQTNPSEY